MEKYSMILEVNDHFLTNHLEDERLEISILIPEKFKSLWLNKLNDLYTTDEEIEYSQSEEHSYPYPTNVSNPENVEKYPMIGETTDRYFANFLEDGRLEISILIPEKFTGLWIDKLNDLYATDEEIEYYRSEETPT